MKTTQNTRFDLFGHIINGYPSKVYQNKTPIGTRQTEAGQGDVQPAQIMGEMVRDYPVNVYKAPGSKARH